MDPKSQSNLKSLTTQNIFNRINLAYGIERKILIVHNHIIFPLRSGQSFDFRKHGYRNDYYTAVSKVKSHIATLDSEINFFYSNISILILAHNINWLKPPNSNFFPSKNIIYHLIEHIPIFINDANDYCQFV